MITSSGYDPATVTVRHGDVVRFVQMDVPAHNIEFHSAPEGARMAPRYRARASDLNVLRPTSPPARVGPFLVGEGRTYEIRIGEDMPEGVYEFGCSRHTKWRGLMVVEDA
jgi:plastocyanin